jgi:hypothetical protein
MRGRQILVLAPWQQGGFLAGGRGHHGVRRAHGERFALTREGIAAARERQMSLRTGSVTPSQCSAPFATVSASTRVESLSSMTSTTVLIVVSSSK